LRAPAPDAAGQIQTDKTQLAWVLNYASQPNPQTRFFSCAPPSSGRTKRFARISMMYPARTTRPKSIAQQIGNSMSQLSRRIDWIVPPPTRSSVANDAHRRIVHKSARRRPTSCAVNFPTRNDANGRNRFCAHALHFDALRDERAGDENRLLSDFFLPLRGGLDRRIGK